VSISPNQTQVPLGYWRAFFVALAVFACVGVVLALLVPDSGGLLALGAYCIPTNSIFPLPHEPGILYFAHDYHPLAITLVATAASTVASLADYAMVSAAMRHPRLGACQQTRLFRWAVKWMQRWPFVIVVLFALTPLPISIIRILAPASGYPIGRYLVAQAVGRLPRFFILAWLGSALHFPAWVLVLMFVALLATFWLTSRSPRVEPLTDEIEEEPLAAS
jgi:membrane protein YqaA with SNARE-associated domain